MKNAYSFYSCIAVLFFSLQLSSQITISEYSASNMNSFLDNYDKAEDWIELHNASSADVDLAGYALSDKETKPRKWVFPTGSIIPSEGYLVVYCSGRDEVKERNYHTNFKLTQTKGNEYVILSDPAGEVLENYLYETTLLAHSHMKTEDGTWRIATQPSPGAANNIAGTYARYTATPEIVQDQGFYENSVSVEVINNEPNSTLRYTLNGETPSATSFIYTSPLTLTSTTVVKVLAFSNDADIMAGKMDYSTFLINEDFTLPVFSIAAEGLIELAEGQGEIRPIGSIEYFEDKKLTATSYGELNRHGQDSWALDQRSLDWVSRDEMGYYKTFTNKLFDYSDRDDYQRFMLRASGDDNYPAINDGNHEFSCHLRDEYVHTLSQEGNMKVDLRAVSRAIVFLNGQYWGIYSPRERPVDHDYTEYYYDQDKFNLQYMLTWGQTWSEYGGKQTFEDWKDIRDYILDNDMSDPANYQTVKDQMQLLSMIDYMIINLNSVCSDWINYNTGVWRGMSPTGNHKKWGYILWDNDATFDYYINYSGVPNTNPDAQPCDIDEIGEFMDDFFGNDGGGGWDSLDAVNCPAVQGGLVENNAFLWEVLNDNFTCCWNWSSNCQASYDILAGGGDGTDSLDFVNCESILNGSSPYGASDSIYQTVTIIDNFCCDTYWDASCQTIYDDISSGTYIPNDPEPFIYENYGKHEKLFLKLLEESPDFQQLYYSRQADMANTAWSCENMTETLDSLAATIAPEMPRHIQRWGGSMSEWEANLARLRTFVSTRCELLHEGVVECYDVSGPHELVLDVFPHNGGHIDINTIEVKEFPWTGKYFGDMENYIDADPNDEFVFVRWETKNGTVVFPDESEEEGSITMTAPDTLIAIFFSETVGTTNINPDEIQLRVYPSPTSGLINIKYTLDEPSDVKISLHNILGERVYDFPVQYKSGKTGHKDVLDLKANNIPTGTYVVRIETDKGAANKKVIFAK